MAVHQPDDPGADPKPPTELWLVAVCTVAVLLAIDVYIATTVCGG